jgi:hypothetical protein
VAFGREPSDVTGEPDDDGGADRTDPDDVGQGGSRCGDCDTDPFLRCFQRRVESGDVIDQFTGDKDPMPGHLPIDNHSLE